MEEGNNDDNKDLLYFVFLRLLRKKTERHYAEQAATILVV